jgi:hypothetical protein
MEEEVWRRHLGSIWARWEASGMVLEVIWESFRDPRGTQMDPGYPGGSRRSWTQKVMPISAKMLKLYENAYLTFCFEGQVTKYCKCQSKMLHGSAVGAAQRARSLIQDHYNPLQINMLGEFLYLRS